MAQYPIRLICNECYSELEWSVSEGNTTDTIYVEPCATCAAEKENEGEDKPNA